MSDNPLFETLRQENDLRLTADFPLKKISLNLSGTLLLIMGARAGEGNVIPATSSKLTQ